MKIGTKGLSGTLITNMELVLLLLKYLHFSTYWPENSTKIDVEKVFSHFTT